MDQRWKFSFRKNEYERRTSNFELRTSNFEHKRVKETDRMPLLSLFGFFGSSFAFPLRSLRFNVGRSMFDVRRSHFSSVP